MGWVRQRGDSFFLVESYRDEAGLSRQRTLGKLILESEKRPDVTDLEKSLGLLRDELVETILEGKDTSEIKAEIGSLEREIKTRQVEEKKAREAKEKAFADVVTSRLKAIKAVWDKEMADIINPFQTKIEEIRGHVARIEQVRGNPGGTRK